MNIKPGIKTSEFYITMLPVVIAGLIYSGVIGQDDTDYIISLVQDVIAGVVALFSIISYVLSRSHLKREILKSQGTQNTQLQTQQTKVTVSELG